jgi:hypothetical protein
MRKLVLWLMVVSLASCHVLESRYQNIKVVTDPPGARIRLNDKYHEQTSPSIIPIRKGKSLIVTLKKEGYYDQKTTLYSTNRRSDLSKYCKWDYYFGWFLFAIPALIAKDSSRCSFFHKDEISVKLVPLKSSTPQDAK